MKLKYYLRGLGTGILFATIILMISYSYRMSDKQIKEQALKLGMVYPDKETTDNEDVDKTTDVETSKEETSSEEATTRSEETENTETATKKEDTQKETDKEVMTKEETTEEETTKEETTEENMTESKNPVDTYILTVTASDVAMDVATKLEDAGIVEDAVEFDEYLIEYGYESNIQNGEFTITKDMSYKEIAEIITKSPR